MTQERRREAQRRYNRKKRMRRRRQRRIAGFVFICVLLVLGITTLILRHTADAVEKDKVCQNVYIGTMNVSGMTASEVRETLNIQIEKDKETEVTVKVGRKTAKTTLKECGLQYKDREKLIKKALNYGKEGSLWKRYWTIRKLSKEKMVLAADLVLDAKETKAVLKKEAVPLADHAVDAVISKSGNEFKIKKSKKGKTVDIKASAKKIQDFINGEWNHQAFAVKAVLVVENPEVTGTDLKTIQDELGSFSTDAGGGERWQNLKTGVEKLNGTVLMPGEELSVHDATAPYDEENGYVPAGSYENGQVVESYGGGICQVSTTLYNAVLYAELEVVERYPHSMMVSYVDPSRDAAIAGDTKDFVFKNNYKTPICIFAEIDADNQMRMSIYGKETRKEGRTIEFEVETISTEEPGVEYRENSEASVGSMNTVRGAHTGKVVELWKIVKQNGKEVERTKENDSTYNKVDQLIEVGTKRSDGSLSSAMQSAIASQSESKIYAAMSGG